jgi:hypothetical protein
VATRPPVNALANGERTVRGHSLRLDRTAGSTYSR